VPEEIHFVIAGANPEVPVIGVEPSIENLRDVECFPLVDEPARFFFSSVSRVTLDDGP
jgi:hypothetical protein